MASTSNTLGKSFGDSLLCPVCFVEYEGRIMQCCQGHAVCEQCHSQLNNCPQCRSIFSGTRNYALEEVILKLKRLQDAQNDFKIGNSKKDDANKVNDINNVQTTDLNELIVTDIAQLKAPTQIRGKLTCRIIGCDEIQPICRLINHVRYFHKEILLEVRERLIDKFKHAWIVKNESFCHAIHIKGIGMFFVIVYISKENNTTTVNGWVQRVSSNNDAKDCCFSLTVKIGSVAGNYNSLVYGTQSDSAHIKSKKHCLYFQTNEISRNIEIIVEIGRNCGPKNIRRVNNTAIIIEPVNPNINNGW